MANKDQKNAQNVAGKWYVTDENDASGQGCISCGLCFSMAPNCFKADDMGSAFVHKQPENADEEKSCQDSMESCPVSAIGSDGE